eukprot:1616094-Alexandrium_andersonii.AAC.1
MRSDPLEAVFTLSRSPLAVARTKVAGGNYFLFGRDALNAEKTSPETVLPEHAHQACASAQ